MIGLMTGIWKYIGIIGSTNGMAPEYVSVLHRVALLDGFAGILLAQFVSQNIFSDLVLFCASFAVVVFLGVALFTYLVHAILKDTDNQFRKPFVLGKYRLPSFIVHGGMILLIVAEIGGFGINFLGYILSIKVVG